MGNCASAPAASDGPSPQKASFTRDAPLRTPMLTLFCPGLMVAELMLCQVRVAGQQPPSQPAAPPAQPPRHSGSGKLLSLQSASSLQAGLDGSKANSMVPPAAPAVAEAPPHLPPVAAKPLTPPDNTERRRSLEQSHKVGPCTWSCFHLLVVAH